MKQKPIEYVVGWDAGRRIAQIFTDGAQAMALAVECARLGRSNVTIHVMARDETGR